MYLFPKHVDGLKGLKNNDDMFAYLSPGHLHVKSYTLYGMPSLHVVMVLGTLDDAKYAFCR